MNFGVLCKVLTAAAGRPHGRSLTSIAWRKRSCDHSNSRRKSRYELWCINDCTEIYPPKKHNVRTTNLSDMNKLPPQSSRTTELVCSEKSEGRNTDPRGAPILQERNLVLDPLKTVDCVLLFRNASRNQELLLPNPATLELSKQSGLIFRAHYHRGGSGGHGTPATCGEPEDLFTNMPPSPNGQKGSFLFLCLSNRELQ